MDIKKKLLEIVVDGVSIDLKKIKDRCIDEVLEPSLKKIVAEKDLLPFGLDEKAMEIIYPKLEVEIKKALDKEIDKLVASIKEMIK